MPDPTCLHVIVTGRVQGVWFRGWTRSEARKLGLAGWVRNRPDGSVEACLQGPQDSVAQMEQRLWQGPEQARVDDLRSTRIAPADLTGFEIRH